MSVFKKNLTSKLLKETSLKIIDKQKYPLKILELGCGDGNISKYLASNEKRGNIFFASDISKKAIRIAKKNYEKKIDFRTGNLFVPWRKKKFNIIISDVSSINDKVAFFSRWYKNIVCHSGADGLRNIKNILINIDKYSEKKVIFILPIISLCNVSSLKILLRKKFKKILFTKKIKWPLPNFFSKNIKIFKNLKDKKNIEFEEKFGMYIAYTRIAICKL